MISHLCWKKKYIKKMDYLGDKLTVAQTHMTQWMGTVRRSLQEALNLVTTAVAHERSGGEGGTRTPFKRTSSFRHFASRSRESFRRFSVRSQQRFSSLRKRQPSSEPPELVSNAPFWDPPGREFSANPRVCCSVLSPNKTSLLSAFPSKNSPQNTSR